MLWTEENNVTSFQICAWFSSRMEQMPGQSTPSVAGAFPSLACRSACNSIKYTYEKTTDHRTGHGCCGVCFARTDQTALGLKCSSKAERENSLARITRSSRPGAVWAEFLRLCTLACRRHWKHTDTRGAARREVHLTTHTAQDAPETPSAATATTRVY